MKTILCYGDSNTWGFKPSRDWGFSVIHDRYSRDERWPGVLNRELGEGYDVIEEGLSGRTTVWDDPIEGYKNGKEYLIPCLDSHKPLDLVIIMLGTNDLKKRFSLAPFDIASGVAALVEIVQRSDAGPDGTQPKVLLLAPPSLVKTSLPESLEMFEDAEDKSKRLAKHYRRVAEEYGCTFLDTSEVIVASKVDGIHLELSEHIKLGTALATQINSVLDNESH